MTRAVLVISRLARTEEGQDLLEYSLVATLIAIVAILAVGSVGDVMNTLWWGPIAGAF